MKTPSKKKLIEVPQDTEFPSYRWFTVIRTEIGYSIISCESNGTEMDPETLKVSEPDVFAITMSKLQTQVGEVAKK